MKPRPRWLSIPDVTALVLARTNGMSERLKGKNRKRQLEAVRRLVVRAERRDDTRITKRLGGDIFVRLDAVESLLPGDAATVTRLEIAVTEVIADTRKVWRHLGGHGAQLRDHGKRISSLEEEQALTTEYLQRIQAVRSRGKAAG